jgi:hypothetical protein
MFSSLCSNLVDFFPFNGALERRDEVLVRAELQPHVLVLADVGDGGGGECQYGRGQQEKQEMLRHDSASLVTRHFAHFTPPLALKSLDIPTDRLLLLLTLLSSSVTRLFTQIRRLQPTICTSLSL